MNSWKAMNLDTDTFKVSLHTSAYNPDIDNDTTTADLSNELAASGNYSTGGETVTNNAVAVDDTNDRAYMDADDPTFTDLTPSSPFRYGVLYSTTDSNNLLGYWDFGTDQDQSGANFVIRITDPSRGGIGYI